MSGTRGAGAIDPHGQSPLSNARAGPGRYATSGGIRSCCSEPPPSSQGRALCEDGARAFLTLCPRSEYVNVADAAHRVAGDRNHILGDAVIKFLSRVGPRILGTGLEAPPQARA